MSTAMLFARSQKLPGCCGVQILHSFTLYNGYECHTIPQLLADWKGTWQATTIRSQTQAASELRKHKFVPQAEFRNPNTGCYVTLWLRAKSVKPRAPRKPKVAAKQKGDA